MDRREAPRPAAQAWGAAASAAASAASASLSAWRFMRGTAPSRPSSSAGVTAPAAPPAAPREEFRDLFDTYVATRVTTGESSTGLTFEGFLRHMRDQQEFLKSKYPGKEYSFRVVVKDGKASLLLAVTKDLAARFPAGELIKPLAVEIGGTGGGRPEMAQAGGKQTDRLDEALAKIAALVESKAGG